LQPTGRGVSGQDEDAATVCDRRQHAVGPDLCIILGAQTSFQASCSQP